jgi:uncharacterized damage-inducible protein DinB
MGDAMAHHLWATDRLIDACGQLSDEQLSSPAAGIYGSIIDTLGHLVGSDRWYLGFFPDFAGDLPQLGEAEGASLTELRAEMGRNLVAWNAILESGLDPDADVPEITPKWEFHVPAGFRLAQAVHHGTDHRSQVCTALTALGIEPPEIDVWAYGEATARSRFVKLEER